VRQGRDGVEEDGREKIVREREKEMDMKATCSTNESVRKHEKKK